MSVWRDLAQDALVMNTDDMLCAGATDRFLFSNTIGRNKFKIPKEVLAEMLMGMEDFFEMLKGFGIEALNTGGETADVGDLVRTIIYDATAFARIPRSRVISNEKIAAGSVIVGLSSAGQASYENAYNSGIGSNGLTNGRHDTLSHSYFSKYPESFDPELPENLAYAGPHSLTEIHPETGVSIGKMLLSPTRTYLPVMKEVLNQHFDQIHGLIHCTGGGQTKVMKFVDKLRVIKDNLMPIPPIFQAIQQASDASWQEMYQVFNMGHRLEVYTDEQTAQAVIDISKRHQIDAQIIGRCEAAEKNHLSIYGPEGVITY